MFLSSHQLDAFYAVAQTLHFSRAAEKLSITQSALSQRVLGLEEELGLTLFIRERAGVQLTEAALLLLRYCQRRQGMEEELLSELAGEKGSFAGTVRIGGFSSVTRSVLLPALGEFIRQHPKLNLEILTRELSELPALLRRAEVDFVVVSEDLKREGLEGFLLGHEEYVLVEAKRSSKLGGTKHPSDFFLDHDPKDETTKSYLSLTDKDFSKIKRRYLDDIYGLIDGVREGLGQAVLPRHLIQGFEDLSVVNPRTILKVPVHLHFHAQPYYTKLHQALVAELKKNGPGFLK